jgi:ABC-2 type transport system permease protein
MAIKTFFRVWTILAKNNLQNQLLSPSASLLFVVGKIFNFIFAIITIYAIFNQASSIRGYDLPQAVIVVLVFSFMDTLTQFLFRSLYTFRPALIKGDFDMDLLKPLPSFFRPIFSGPDFLDVPMIIIQLFSIFYFIAHFSITITLPNLLVFSLVFVNGVVIAFSVHLIIAAFAVMTSEIENLVMIYRALGRAAIVPTDIYGATFRFILSYVVPITVIMTIPAKALLGILSIEGIIYSTILTLVFLIFSLNFWSFSLRHYTSASS